MIGDPRDSAARLGRYLAARVNTLVAHVGTGSYALLGHFDDGSRALSFIGFDTVADAESFGAFIMAQQQPPKPDAAQAQLMQIGGALGLILPTPVVQERALLALQPVALVVAAPSDALAGLVP